MSSQIRLGVSKSAFRKSRSLPKSLSAPTVVSEALECRRLLSAGFLNSSFGTNGIAPFGVGTNTNDATSGAAQSNGQIVLAGDAVSGSKQSAFIARVNSNGSPDTTYGTGGASTLRLNGNTIATGVSIDPTTGDAVICGVVGANTSSGSSSLSGLAGLVGITVPSGPSGLSGMAFIAKYDTSGNLVTSFGTNGVVMFAPFGGTAVASDVWVQSNGTIAVTGTSLSKYGVGIMFALFSSNGSVQMVGGGPDENAFEPASGHAAVGTHVARGLSKGEYVVSGFDINLSTGQFTFEVVEFGDDSGVVGTFGNNGAATASFGNKVEVAMGVTVDSTTGDIYAAGASSNGFIRLVPALPSDGSPGHATASEFAVASFKPDGSLNSAFNGTGMQTETFSAGAVAGASSIAEQNNGDFIVNGSVETGTATADLAAVRLLSNGTLDTTFADGGKETANLYGSAGIFGAIMVAAPAQSQSLTADSLSPAGLLPASSGEDDDRTEVEVFWGHDKPTSEFLDSLVFGDPYEFSLHAFSATTSAKPKDIGYAIVGELTNDGSAETMNPGPTPALSTTLTATLPMAVVSGNKATGFKASVTITNTGSAPATGAATLTPYLSTSTTLNTSTAAALTPIKTALNLLPGKSIKEQIHLANFPMGLDGNYYLLTQLTGGGVSTTENSASTTTVDIAPAFYNLQNLGVIATPTSIVRGKTKLKISTTVENAGNSLVNGAMGLDIALSSSASGAGATPLALPAPLSVKLHNLAPGKTLKISEMVILPTTLAAGDDFIVVTIDPANTFMETTLSDNTMVDPTMVTVT